MEQDEDTSPVSPFWVPKNNHRRLRRSYSLFLTTTSLFVLLLVTLLVFALVVVPTLRSFTSTIFKPQAVKHSWNSLNLILVLFAVVCGFLTKNDTNEIHTPRSDNNSNYHHQRSFSNPVTPPSWYENSNRSFNRLRSIGSYPDLHQHSPWSTDDERCRFYDDTHPILRNRYPRLQADVELVVENARTVTFGEVSGSPVRLPSLQPPLDFQTESFPRNADPSYEAETIEKPEINDVPTENLQSLPPQPPPVARKKKREIATKENASTVTPSEFSTSPVLQQDPEPQQPPSAPPPLLPATRTKPVRRNAKRTTYQAEMIQKPEINDYFAGESSQPPPPPPLPAEMKTDIHGKKKRGSATKEFLISLRRKKKKQRQKSVENFESLLNSHLAAQPKSPPPPPTPPPSVFHNILSFNKSKNKTHYLVPVATYKPLLPNKKEQSYRVKDNVVMTGNESPLIPIPPPPPPPPFKLPAWKFRVQGDFVRVDSIGSSRSGSPDSDEVVESETSQCNSPFAPNGEDPVNASGSDGSLFCPSPDVDTKAHNFIENFRAGLRMAKMNSIKEKHGIGRSNLGPLPKP